jgi:anaerobic selenocysteine-containing dehydrogenase
VNNYEEFLGKLDRKAYHEGEVRWEEGEYQVTRSNHWSPPGCHNSCGVLLYVKDGKLEKVEGDPLSPHVNGKLCMRCLNLPETTNHPDRIKYPMIRAGERGENKWKRISWDEALDIIKEKVDYIQSTYGHQAICLVHGTGRNVGWPVPVLAYLGFQTPMVLTLYFTGISCYLPRVLASNAAQGDYSLADTSLGHEDRYANKEWQVPGVIMVWGNEPIKSNADGYMGHWLVECVQLGSKVISIDPRVTWWAVHADYHLPVRPGTDAALAMAMLKVIIDEDMYDHDFVKNWTYGFDEMLEMIKDATPEWAAEVCGIDAEDIRGAARLWATSGPGALQWGLAFEQQADCMGLNIATMNLVALCGYLDVPGGMVLVRNAFDLPLHLSENYLDPVMLSKKINHKGPDAPWGDSVEYLQIAEANEARQIRMYWFQSSNTIACAGQDPPRLYDIIRRAEFNVCADPFITPTAIAFCDLLLPIAMSSERNAIRTWWTPLRAQIKACSYYEAVSDEELCLIVGKKLNPEAFEAWETDRDIIQWRLAENSSFVEGANEAGIGEDTDDGVFHIYDNMYNLGGERWTGALEDLENMGCYAYDKFNSEYYKYKNGRLRSDGEPGFATPSGKYEFTPFAYKMWGWPDGPYYLEPYQSPVETPEVYKEYPLIMNTGGRSFEFFHSEHRQLPSMREFHKWPLLQINAIDAEKYGLENGEWAWVENEQARFRQVVQITPTIKPGTIHVEHGWWFPEQKGEAPYFFGTFDSNPNNCIPADVTGPLRVAAPIKNMLVKVYPYKEGDVMPGEVVSKLDNFPLQKARRKAYEAKYFN